MRRILSRQFTLAACLLAGASSAGAGDSFSFGPAVMVDLDGQPAGVQIADFNGDGHLDIGATVDMFALGSAAVVLNDGKGNFSPPIFSPIGSAAGEGGLFGLEVGDMDGDDDVDIVFSRLTFNDASVLLALNNGDGSFAAPVSAGFLQMEFAVPRFGLGDFDGDDHIDIARSFGPEVGFNDGTGTMTGIGAFTTNSQSVGIEVADLNGDGAPDIIYGGVTHVNDGKGGFASAGVLPDTSLYAVADLDGNASSDVVAAGEGFDAHLSFNNGDGTFEATVDISLPIGVDGVAVGRINDDPHPDIVFGTFGGDRVLLLAGVGGGGFANVEQFDVADSLGPVAVGDLNGDGLDDVVVAHGGLDIFENEFFNFGGVTVFLTNGSSASCAADFDGDGGVASPDLAVLLGAWGTDGADLDGDGITGSADLALLLGAWGPCP